MKKVFDPEISLGACALLWITTTFLSSTLLSEYFS